MKNKKIEYGKLAEEESIKASFELSDSFFNSNLTNTSTVKNGSSPFNLNKISSEIFLSKKRKNSDLNFENFATFSNSKNSNKKNSPFLSDSKITSYFPQKKNSSDKKSSELQSSNKSSKIKSLESSNGDLIKMSQPREDNKITCAKKLIFDNVEQSLNNKDFNSNFNIQFSQNRDFKFLKNCHLERNSNNHYREKLFDNEIKLKFSKNENFARNKNSDIYVEKNFSEIEKIFERTKNKFSLSQHTLDVINKIEANKKTKNSHNDSPKTLKLSLEKLSSSHIDKNKINNFYPKLNSKDNSPSKNSKSSQSELVRSSQEILSNYSIKEKYEELLRRELILPCHYKNLLNKFGKLDETLNYLKRSGNSDTSLKQIEKILFENFRLDFTPDDFEKILYVTPHFFIYKWDKNFKSKIEFDSSSNELFIDVPNDIARRLSHKYDDKINFSQLQTFPYIPLKFEMSEDILKDRASSFKKILLFMTNEHHKKILKEKRINTKLNPFKHRTWHSEFDVHSVPQLENFRLIEKPKVFR